VEEEVDPWTYFFGRPGEFQRDLALLNVSPSKFVLAGVLAIVIGLGANLWGETEFFLGLFPAAGEAARELRLDSIYAVDGLKGYYEPQYQLRYPSTWLFDQRVALAKFGQLDGGLMTLSGPRGASKLPGGVLPDAAWGPAGGGQRPAKERENLSVVKQLLPPGLASMEDVLGEPEASLEKLLRETIAPAGSKRTVEPLRAVRTRRAGPGAEGSASAAANVYYEYEWRTRFDAGFALRTYSSAALGPPDAQGRRFLYTLTMVVPEGEAASGEGAVALLPRVLESFRVALS